MTTRSTDISTDDDTRPATDRAIDAGPGRRAVMMGAAAIALTGAAGIPAPAASVKSSLAGLRRRRGGRLGVFALDVRSGATLAFHADERFKLMSTFKALLTAMALRETLRDAITLDTPIAVTQDDLLDASPVTETYVARGRMTVGELCAATMTRSDNAAANLLMRRLGGPERVTAFLRAIGDGITRVDHYEGELSGHPPAEDSSTPRAMVDTVRRIMSDAVLPPPLRRKWEGWMTGNVVGARRLRAGFPAHWLAGDRTGTGDGVCNDVAFARKPDGGMLLVSAYRERAGLALADQEAEMRAIGRLLAGWQDGL